MNFFQQQLKWILGNQPEFQDAKYVGRACFVPLADGTRIKAEFITRGTHERYEALKLTAMNKSEGQIDATVLEFKDYFATPERLNGGEFFPAYLGLPGKAGMVRHAKLLGKGRAGRGGWRVCPAIWPGADGIVRHGTQSVGGKGHERVGAQSAAGRADQESLSAGYAHFVEPYGRSSCSSTCRNERYSTVC